MSGLIFLGRSKEKAVTVIITDSFRLLTLLGRAHGAECSRYKSIKSSAPKRPLSRLQAPRLAPGADGNMFVVNTVVNTGPVQIAPTHLIAVMARKIKQTFSKREHIPLPLITSFRSPLGGLPLETIQPLATRAEAWQAIPGVSDWVMGIIKLGYSLHFAQRSPRFSGVVPTSVQSKDSHVLRSEVMTLLAKGAIETVPPAQRESGFYSVTSSSPKRMKAHGPSSISDTWIAPS